MKQSEIVEAVRAGRGEFSWVELEPGLEVMADALKIDGVRVNVSATTAQRCADLLGASLTTPAIEDLIHQLAGVRIPAFTIPTGPDASWSQTVWHSKQIDAALAKANAIAGMLVSTVGKAWCLINGLILPTGRPKMVKRRDGSEVEAACNYGWPSPGAPHSPATGTQRVWQSIGTKHGRDHHDYSQTLRLCRGTLRTHEGELRVTRQPGVPFERDTEPGGGAVGSGGVIVLPEVVIRALPPKPAVPAAGDDPGTPFRQARHFRAGRAGKAVRWVVIHTAEVAEVGSAAEGLQGYAATMADGRVASWHYACDADSATQSVREADIAYHCPGLNAQGIGVELAGRAGQNASQWADAYSAQVLDRAAALVARICRRNGVPIVRVGPAELLAGRPGICGHVDGSLAFKKSTHTDPGPRFPWDNFLELVRAYDDEPTSPESPAAKG